MRSRAPPGGGLRSTRSSSTERLTSCPEGRPGSRPPKEKPPYLWGGGVRGQQVKAREGGAGKPPSGQAEGAGMGPSSPDLVHPLLGLQAAGETDRKAETGVGGMGVGQRQ